MQSPPQVIGVNLKAVTLVILLSFSGGPGWAQGQSIQRSAVASRGYAAMLPPTNMDSFVRQSGAHANHIYGDEGVDGPPPYMGFNKPHRINTGIMDQRDEGITTGHGSLLPDAWGKDEFLGLEVDQSGKRGLRSDQGFPFGEPDTLDPGSGADPGAGGNPYGIPPAPGPGYKPMMQHGVQVGWWSPDEIKLCATNFKAALLSILNSDRYYGGESGKISILLEIGLDLQGNPLTDAERQAMLNSLMFGG